MKTEDLKECKSAEALMGFIMALAASTPSCVADVFLRYHPTVNQLGVEAWKFGWTKSREGETAHDVWKRRIDFGSLKEWDIQASDLDALRSCAVELLAYVGASKMEGDDIARMAREVAV